MTIHKHTSPLPLFNLLLAGSALAVAVAALATDEAGSGPAAPGVAPFDAAQTPAEVRAAVAAYAVEHELTGLSPASLQPITTHPDDEINDPDEPLQLNPSQPPISHTGTPAGDCVYRRLVVRC